MKSLIPSVVTGLVVAAVLLAVEHRPAELPMMAAPSGSWLLYAIAFVLVAPFLKEGATLFGKAWWSRAKGTVDAGRGLVAMVGQRFGSGATWKGFAVTLVVGIAIGMVFSGGVRLPSFTLPSLPNFPSIVAPTQPTAVTYVYEKDAGGIPSGVASGISKLNAQGILATTFEEDTTDGSGETPEQYKAAKEAATKAGLPALVVQAGNVATKVVKGPTTEQHVLEAAK